MVPNSVVLNTAVMPLHEPERVALRARFEADTSPRRVQELLDEAVTVPTRYPPHIALEEVDRDEVVVRIVATPDRPGDGAELDEALLRSERDATIWRAFRGLPERCRTLLRVLMADPPPAYTTVAAALDIPVGSIGPTRQRCLAALRRIMTGDARRSAASTETMRGEP
jgi:DNA-directed RNA polymerase specialized sigma24 family protein